jgi:hypothetical protein
MGESTRWSRMLTRLPIHQTWHDRNENPKQAAYPVQILKLRRTREFPENVRIGGSTPICAMHEPPSTQPDPPQPDPKGHHSRPSGLPPSPPAEESANRARQTDPGPGRGAPSAAGTRGRRDRSQPRSWSPWSAPGPHATGHPWSSPGTSGHDQRTRTAGHTAFAAPAWDGQAAAGRVRALTPAAAGLRPLPTRQASLGTGLTLRSS